MIDLSTEYMGLNLKNPIIVGASGLTASLDSMKKLEQNGAAAVVLHSLFEEQILMNISNSTNNIYTQHTESNDYLNYYEKMHIVEKYIDLIKAAKKELSIPVIASINCSTDSEWTEFAREIEKSGADGLELNMFILPSGFEKDELVSENDYVKIINKIRKEISIPIALKIGFYFSNLAHTVKRLSQFEIEGIVLFNRYFRSDIDLNTESIITGDMYSAPQEYLLPLRWIALLATEVECDLCASTGIHSADSVIKQIFAGAKAVQMVSAIYLHNIEYINEILSDINNWMEQKGYQSLADFRGKISQTKISDLNEFERVQFMKYQDGLKG